MYWAVRVVCVTVRLRVENYPADDAKTIFCGWHGRSLLFADLFRGRGWWVIISNSNDGDLQNQIFSKLGYRSIRGSSKRDGVRAAVEGIRVLRNGGTMAITPDGPRGPSGVVQGGVLTMAQKSGAKLVPVGISANPRIHAKSWDRYLIPFFFSRAILIFGNPITVPPNATEEEIEARRLELEEAIHRLEGQAEKRVGVPPRA
jgi:lysophospholipid acyltransferase (LPLAT)-like uncharacterized protein